MHKYHISVHKYPWTAVASLAALLLAYFFQRPSFLVSELSISFDKFRAIHILLSFLPLRSCRLGFSSGSSSLLWRPSGAINCTNGSECRILKTTSSTATIRVKMFLSYQKTPSKPSRFLRKRNTTRYSLAAILVAYQMSPQILLITER